MDSSSSSPLSTPPQSDTEAKVQLKSVKGKLQFVPTKKAALPLKSQSTPDAAPKKRKRSPSPPHEYVLADNFDIAFLVAFRARFNEAFSRAVPHLGPQDIERGIVDTVPSEQIEALLCALLGLALNRKKPVEKGHYQRALEEVVTQFKSQWPKSWAGVSPLSGSKTFHLMDPTERLRLLRCLVLWSLSGSEVVQAILKQSYKGGRQPDDLNQHLSIQPWGKDWDKRTYYLIEGQDDTCFRIYREKGRYNRQGVWISVAGDLDQARAVANALMHDGSQAGTRLGTRILAAIPRLEAGEEKRRKREHRYARRAAFTRPEPGFSLYEGRTRGRKMNYAYSEAEDYDFEDSDLGSRKRARNQGNTDSPAETAPTTTRSGRISKPRGANGDLGVDAAYGVEQVANHSADSDTPAVQVNGGFDHTAYESADDQTSEGGEQANESGYEDQGSEVEDNEDDLSDAADEDEVVPERRTLKVALRVPVSTLDKKPAGTASSAPPDSGYQSVTGESVDAVRQQNGVNQTAA